MFVPRSLPAFLVSVAMSLSAPAYAQPGDQQARLEAFTRAQDAIAAKKWSDARRILTDLWNDARTYDVALSLGQVEIKLLEYRNAAEHLAFGLRNVPPRESAELTRRSTELLDLAKEQVGTVRVLVSSPKAEVFAGSSSLGTSPLESEIYLEPGAHAIRAQLGNDAVDEKKIDIQAGRAYVIALDPRTAQTTSADPAAPLAPANADENPQANPSTPREGKSNTLPLILGGGAVVGLGVGVGFLVAAGGKESQRDDILDGIPGTNRCGPGTPNESECARAEQLNDDASTFRTIGFVGLGVGIVAAGAAVAFLVWPNDDRSAGAHSPSLAVIPNLSPRNLGGALVGEF